MANSQSGESVVHRVVQILAAFDNGRSSLSIPVLARKADLPVGTVYRLVGQLVDERILSRVEDGSVQVGIRLWEFGSRALQLTTLRQAALPFMEDVQAIAQQHTTLSVLDDGQVLYLEHLADPNGATDSIVQIARRLPLHASSSGLVMLAHSEAWYQNEFLERPFKRYTPDTITDPVAIRNLLHAIRVQGYAAMPGLIVPSLIGIAVPVLDYGGAVLGALSVVAPREVKDQESIIAVLKTAARGLSRAYMTSESRISRVPIGSF